MCLGQYLCDEVKVKVTGKISDIIHCHCSLCRKSTGSAYATNGFVDNNEFSVIQGKALLNRFSFKPGRHHHFFSNSGSPVYSSNEQDASRVRLRLCILESEINERPMSHNFVSSKANWEDLDSELPRYDSFEPGRK